MERLRVRIPSGPFRACSSIGRALITHPVYIMVTMRTIRDHLSQRHLDFYVHPSVMIDEDERVATFFLYNLSGKIVGYQHYRPDASKERHNHPKEGRYYTYRNKGEVAVFGLETLSFHQDVLFVVEGIFDATRLTKYQVPCIATLSNDPNRDLRNWILSLGRKIVAVCDSGKAGKKLAKVGDMVYTVPEGDLGDAPEEYVLSLIEEVLHHG